MLFSLQPRLIWTRNKCVFCRAEFLIRKHSLPGPHAFSNSLFSPRFFLIPSSEQNKLFFGSPDCKLSSLWIPHAKPTRTSTTHFCGLQVPPSPLTSTCRSHSYPQAFSPATVKGGSCQLLFLSFSLPLSFSLIKYVVWILDTFPGYIVSLVVSLCSGAYLPLIRNNTW